MSNPIQGINANRLPREPLERKFSVLWDHINDRQRVLSYILDRSQANRGDYNPTKVEIEVVATVIQWLGSPVGQGFLADIPTS